MGALPPAPLSPDGLFPYVTPMRRHNEPSEQHELFQPQEELELSGELERITFTAEDTGFTVAKLRVREDGKDSLVTVVAHMVDPQPGQLLHLKGSWQVNPRYGNQFRATSCKTTLPASLGGLRAYLQSGLVKGIGAQFADRIIEHFGLETMAVLDQEPERLLEVEGIGPKRLQQFKEVWREQQDVRELMVFLQEHEVSGAYAVRIHKFYGPAALGVLKENPYRMAMDIPRVGFLTADAIARKLGIAQDSPVRVQAAAHYVLRQSTDQGHVFLPLKELVRRCCEMLEVEAELVEAAVERLKEERRVVEETLPGEHGRAVYLTGYHVAEEGVAAKLLELMTAPKTVRPIEAEKAIAWVQGSLGITLAQKQAEAVRAAAQSKVLVLTGGPGTGKTTIIIAILRIFQAIKAKALLAAPTGRAAKRMAEATRYEAMTVHRLLEYSPQAGAFKRNEETPLDCSLLIVDEASMLDLMLSYHLLKAVPKGTTLVLVGDVNQLPSVGPGNVLKDIIASERCQVVELDEIFRQARESAIVMNAHAINKGCLPQLTGSIDEPSDFYFVRREDPEAAAQLIVELVQERIPRRFGFDPLQDIQVLTPMHKGAAGAQNLNHLLQAALNPRPERLQRAGRTFRLGDKVMQVRNNYDKDIYNGDIGRIVALNAEEGRLEVLFDDRVVPVEGAELEELILAYATSIHKSQGSEYPAVVVPVLTQHYILLQRNLLYTAVTRGKKLVVLVGSQRAVAIAVNNNLTHKRFTYLEHRLAPWES